VSAAGGGKTLWGLLAEFRTADDLRRAAAVVREAGYERWDAHTPFPVHGLDDAMGIRPTRLPWVVLAAGIAIIVSGKPFFSLPAQIPVAFELTILLASLTAFLGMLGVNALPRLHHPLFANKRFRRASNDAFFISVEATDRLFDVEATDKLLRSAGSLSVEWIEG
jgi:hypothetical protein